MDVKRPQIDPIQAPDFAPSGARSATVLRRRPGDLVRAWAIDWFHNANLPTHVQNRIGEAVDDLVKRLEAARKE